MTCRCYGNLELPRTVLAVLSFLFPLSLILFLILTMLLLHFPVPSHSGACEALVLTLNTHAEDYEVAISGCHATYNLSLHNQTNQLRFGAVGGCEVIVQIFRCHGFEPCKKYFDLMKTLTDDNDDNVERFIALGVKENLSTFEEFGMVQRGACVPYRMFFT